MANLLFLAHRLPYPPNKGDKVRSYHLLRHLAERHRVFLGTFVDDPEDEAHVDTVRQWCAEVHVPRLHPRRAKLASLAGLLRREPLTLAYYRSASMQAWVDGLRSRRAVDCTLVFSSSMAPYAEGFPRPALVDFVDVDSAKWTEYAGNHRWPLSWLYRREGRTLLAYERAVASRADQSFFAADREAALFCGLAPESAPRVTAITNGVDAAYWAPRAELPSPFAPGEQPLVFTGAMDYWPNIDAVTWFVREMLPRLRASRAGLRLHIVGRSPAPAVRALAGEAVAVTGTVPDVRPYLQHAAVVVAPLRLARGIQNKVLEAMAMGRPVVAAAACTEAITAARPGEHLLAAESAEDYVREVGALLREPARAAAIGQAGRDLVRRAYGWDARLQALDSHLAAAPAPRLQPA